MSTVTMPREALLAAANRLSDIGQNKFAAPLWEALANHNEKPLGMVAPAAKYSWRDICDMVSEVIGCEFTPDPNSFIGHQMTGINFNSLARIIDKVASPPAPVAVDERAEFVAWVRREWPQAPLSNVRDLLPKNDPRYGEYCDETLQRAWVGWQARACLDKVKELNQ